ncbi:MAG: AmmeMemoRadiSam system protein A, partial [Deltaproteobacteria bacterium]|nr:AmmeMemoRadiSam system protein A [Deltaproteobacteria bacterium]
TPDTLIVASSDFTHYGPNYGYVPFKTDAEKNLKKLADDAFKSIASLNPKKFESHLDGTDDTICGEKPIRVLMNILPPDSEAKLLKFDTSGKITGDFTNSVSYESIAFFTKNDTLAYHGIRVIDREDEETLLKLARLTLKYHLQKKAVPDPVKEGLSLSGAVKESYGVFVTLRKNGSLRGCIGSIMPVEPLFEGVIRNAVNAASHDPRFEPVKPEEEKDIHIEISVLSKPEKVGGIKDIVIGRDGIIISKGGRRAVFLPQVPVEENWDVDTTLSYLSMKAGLPSNAYKEGMEFETFRAQVFEENK